MSNGLDRGFSKNVSIIPKNIQIVEANTKIHENGDGIGETEFYIAICLDVSILKI